MASAQQVAQSSVEAFNSHDADRIKAMYAADAVVEAPGDVRLEGVEAATGYAMGWLNAFPDAAITVHNVFGAGAWVAHEFTFEGTHDEPLVGPAGEIPATHKRVTGRGIDVFRIEGDKVAEEHLYFDQVQLLSQLGVMPEMASATA